MGINYVLLGKNIKYYRKQKKMTQEELAEKVGLSIGFISQVERGITRMSLDTLIDICNSLDCSAGDILDHVQANPRPAQSEDVLALFNQLPQRDQSLFFHMLKAYTEHL